ncbi:hypothetical protein Acr_00g0049780 [Actinidia rufa]|uniref:Uncharacterized protein n=1 Tax=Actinidia rufa TaxID=165716 RepID=A0A7J0DL02_9ERIC|nr:hypothetical protein Acr_00g0049780 [Actinidia rufa]
MLEGEGNNIITSMFSGAASLEREGEAQRSQPGQRNDNSQNIQNFNWAGIVSHLWAMDTLVPTESKRLNDYDREHSSTQYSQMDPDLLSQVSYPKILFLT